MYTNDERNLHREWKENSEIKWLLIIHNYELGKILKFMEKKSYSLPTIRIRIIAVEHILTGGSINNVNNDGTDIGYGGEGEGPAFTPEWGNIWGNIESQNWD